MTRATVAWRSASSQIPAPELPDGLAPTSSKRKGLDGRTNILCSTGPASFTGRLIARMAIVHPTGRSGAGQDLVSRVLTSVTLGWCGVMAYTISLGGRLLPGQGHHRT